MVSHAIGGHTTVGARTGRRRQRVEPFVFWLVPILGLLFAFAILPILGSLYLSLYQFEALRLVKFVGLGNYSYAFSRDPTFLITLRNTAYFAFVSVPLGMAGALFIAQLIYTRPRLKGLFRSTYFLPVVTPIIAVTIVWKFILQPSQFGLLNGILVALDLPPQRWLNSSSLVIPSLILVSIWNGIGYNIVLFLAGLGGIPGELYEAAKIDGANPWRMFASITWPMLSPTVLFVTVTGSIGAMQVFALPYVMTRGGPENASRMVVMWIQETAFGQFRMGYASALAYIFFAIVLVLTLVELRYLRTRWSY